MQNLYKVGFGGGCHWCTEAVFMSLRGVTKVAQGFISPKENIEDFSEAVIVHFNQDIIALEDLVAIHLDSHRSTQNHSMRNKYRSGIYFFEKKEESVLAEIMRELQKDFDEPIITSIIPFGAFTSSQEQFQNYYFSDTEKPFCKTHISPKIKFLKEKYAKHVVIK